MVRISFYKKNLFKRGENSQSSKSIGVKHVDGNRRVTSSHGKGRRFVHS